jgi:hypothetical protein
MQTRRALLVAAATAPFASLPRRASALQAPKGPVVLTVSGALAHANDGRLARFDLEMLDAIGRASFTTATPWHNRPAHFEGIAGKALMQAVGAGGTSVSAVALNDYASTIPMSDFMELGLLIANRVDGRRMTVREKGPLWIVYPFESSPKLNSGVYHGRSVWQLARLEIR